jgi:hypothetical protein
MRGLIHFAKTGAVTHDLKNHLRHQARSPSHPNRPYAGRVLQHRLFGLSGNGHLRCRQTQIRMTTRSCPFPVSGCAPTSARTGE